MDEKLLVPIIVVPLFLVIMLVVFSGTDDSSVGSNSETLSVSSYDSFLVLQQRYVAEGSETVKNVTGGVLTKGVDYDMNYNSGNIKICGVVC